MNFGNNSIRLHGLEVGAFNNGDRQFDAYLDDIRIYDNTLTQSELDALIVPVPGSLLLMGCALFAFLWPCRKGILNPR